MQRRINRMSTSVAACIDFMMVWDRVHEVFFLLTGNWKDGMTVWALRLDLVQQL
jgi:hypothetical protein